MIILSRLAIWMCGKKEEEESLECRPKIIGNAELVELSGW